MNSKLRIPLCWKGGFDYVYAPIDPSWHIAHNKHPDARGSYAIAKAIADRLNRDGCLGASEE